MTKPNQALDDAVSRFGASLKAKLSGKGALVDVEIEVAGASFGIVGVQARREPGDMTSIRLPTFKDTNGTWQAAIRLPSELVDPMGDAVLAFLVEEGLAKRRF